MRQILMATVMVGALGACMTAQQQLAPAETMLETVSEAVPETAPDYRASGWVAKTLPELAAALEAGDLTSAELTAAYLARIEAVDRSGPTLQAVLAINPDALAQAEASDARRTAGTSLGPLDGIPILLKDNIESLDPIATTAGALALKDNITGRDSPLVAGLRAQGAVILGKTNLSQWANFRSNDSMSGWSALGGQVRNPHMLDRNPCGSSSGSGSAAAASLAAGTVGTETNGSIICPSNVNGLVGFKPTVGLIPQDLIIPISPSQDTAGPMTKSVMGAAMMMDAMTQNPDLAGKASFASMLDAGSLEGRRVGVLRFAQGSNADIQERLDAALSVLETQGAILVDIEDFSPDAENFWGDALTVLQYEFKDSLNAYLASTPETVTTRTLADLIAFNEANAEIELALFNQDIFEASEELGPLSDEAYIKARDAIQLASRDKGIDQLMVDNDVDMLVSPSGPISPRIDPINGDTWPAWAGAGYLAAIAGYPHITVPMGEVHGVPIGFSIMSGKNTDAQVLSWGYAFEQASQMRVDPQYLSSAEDRPEITEAMKAK